MRAGEKSSSFDGASRIAMPSKSIKEFDRASTNIKWFAIQQKPSASDYDGKRAGDGESTG